MVTNFSCYIQGAIAVGPDLTEANASSWTEKHYTSTVMDYLYSSKSNTTNDLLFEILTDLNTTKHRKTKTIPQQVEPLSLILTLG